MMSKLQKSLLRTVSILSIAAACMLLPACSTARGLTSTDNRQQLSARFQRDSVYLHDSIFVRIRADTVYLEKWHTRWKKKEIVKTDTIQVETTRTETIPVRYVPSFYKYCTAFAILVLVILLLRFAWWLYHKFYFGGPDVNQVIEIFDILFFSFLGIYFYPPQNKVFGKPHVLRSSLRSDIF